MPVQIEQVQDINVWYNAILCNISKISMQTARIVLYYLPLLHANVKQETRLDLSNR